MRITQGDEVRVYYGPPGQVMSFVEGVVCRMDVTTTRGRGFLIDITRDVLLGREQPIKLGYQHFVLYEQVEASPEKVEMLSQAQVGPASHLEHRSVLQVQEESEAEPEAAPELDPKPSANAEQDTEEPVPEFVEEVGEAPARLEHQNGWDGGKGGSRVISLFGWRK